MLPKNPPTVRQWKLIEILKKSKRGLTLADIADRLGMDARTIRRDLAKLKKSGLPIQEKTEAHGRILYRIDENPFTPAAFNFEEAAAFYLGYRFLAPLSHSFLGEAAKDGLRKIRKQLGTQHVRILDQQLEIFRIECVPALWRGIPSGKRKRVSNTCQERKPYFRDFVENDTLGKIEAIANFPLEIPVQKILLSFLLPVTSRHPNENNGNFNKRKPQKVPTPLGELLQKFPQTPSKTSDIVLFLLRLRRLCRLLVAKEKEPKRKYRFACRTRYYTRRPNVRSYARIVSTQLADAEKTCRLRSAKNQKRPEKGGVTQKTVLARSQHQAADETTAGVNPPIMNIAPQTMQEVQRVC